MPTSLQNSEPIGALRKWRVLVAHNRYQQRGGEDAVVDAEVNLLRDHGHEVIEYQRDNHDLAAMPRAKAALQTLWSSRTTREVGELIDQFAPDVLHVHNTFPLISPSIYWLAQRRRLPVVQTLHNFRLICPQALMLRNDKPCEDCVGKLPWRGVAHACYRDSRLQTGLLACAVSAHRLAGTWQHKVTRYIALNDFCRDRFIAGGLPAEKIIVKPNFVDLPAPGLQARAGFLFVGRLSIEKGIRVLVNAVRGSALQETLTVVGTGPETSLLNGVPRLQPLGALAPAAVYAQMRQARALVLPSICYENFPLTLVEAYACALPVIASRHGAMASLVEDGQTGLLFEPGNSTDLAAKLEWAMDHPAEMEAMGQHARTRYEAQLTGRANIVQLYEVYRQATSLINS